MPCFQTIYNAMLENNCSEHASRMSAMENSTKSAGEMLNKLTLSYNRWDSGRAGWKTGRGQEGREDPHAVIHEVRKAERGRVHMGPQKQAQQGGDGCQQRCRWPFMQDRHGLTNWGVLLPALVHSNFSHIPCNTSHSQHVLHHTSHSIIPSWAAGSASPRLRPS